MLFAIQLNVLNL